MVRASIVHTAASTSLDSTPILSVEQLYWHANEKAILQDISFSMAEGEFVGLLGPNGAGKSTLLRCIYRFLSPSSGNVFFQGKNIWQYRQKDYAKALAVVLQESPAHFNLSVTDVVGLGLLPKSSVWHRTSKEEIIQINAALEQVAMLDKREQAFEQLSGGEKQRVLIARAIVQQPKLLVMDEPTSHLDVKYQIQIMELAKSLGITVLASFHDLNLASAMCDNLLVLDNGQLVANGTPHKVLTADMLSSVFDVCTEVNRHPQVNAPHITYYYGYRENGHD